MKRDPTILSGINAQNWATSNLHDTRSNETEVLEPNVDLSEEDHVVVGTVSNRSINVISLKLR